jgi:hypothetical protein
MSRIARPLGLAALVGAAVSLAASPANAQVMVGGGVGATMPGGLRTTPIGPLGVPLQYPGYNYRSGLNVQIGSPLGLGPSIGYGQMYSGPVGWWLSTNNTALAPRYYTYPRAPTYNYGYDRYGVPTGASPGYVSGGVRNPALYGAQQNLGNAQQQQSYQSAYAPGGARAAINSQWRVETGSGTEGGPVGPPPNAPPDLLEALAAANELKLMSGEYLNRIKTEIEALEARGVRAPSPQFGPQLLNQVWFAGSPAADGLNVIRRAGRLEFPIAFDTIPELRNLRPTLEQDLVAAVSPLRLGKPIDPLKVIKLDEDVGRAHAALTPAINTLAFEDATAARRLLNNLGAAAKVLRDPKSAGLVNPAWDTAGVSVSDLLKHMTKYKLQFGPADAVEGEAYVAVHQGLAGYLFALQQNEPKKK